MKENKFRNKVAELKTIIVELKEENEILKIREKRWRNKYLNLVTGCLSKNCKVMKERIKT